MYKILGSFLIVLILLSGCNNGGSSNNIIAGVNNDADLASLILSVVALDPVFDADTTDYTATVDNGTENTTVTFDTLKPLATGTVNGTAVDSGATSDPVELAVGDTTITIIITSEDGDTTQCYRVSQDQDSI